MSKSFTILGYILIGLQFIVWIGATNLPGPYIPYDIAAAGGVILLTYLAGANLLLIAGGLSVFIGNRLKSR
jgi:hypothetical protein